MMFILLLVILVSVLFIRYLQIYKDVNRMKKIAWNIPGPKPLPVVGHMLSFGNNAHDSFQYLKKVTKQYGPVTAIWICDELQIYISDKEDMKAVLTSNVHLKKAKIFDFTLDWVGRGLLTAFGDRWRHNRKLLTPTFHFKMLGNYIDIFNSNYKILTDLLETEVGNDGFDILLYLGNCVTDNLYESALKINNSVQLNKNGIFAESLINVRVGVVERILNYWLRWKTLFNLTSSGKKYNKGLAYIHGFTSQVISDKKKNLKEKEIKKEEHKEERFTDKKKLAFIDLLLQIAMDPQSNLNDEDLLYEINTFVSAGHGTMTATLGFIVYELAQHQDIQDRVVQEIEDYFGDDKRQPTFQDLQHFPYLEMVIKEALRFYPATYLGRHVLEDFTLPSGYTIPAGSCVLFDWLHLHKDPAEYADPENFNPDHFLPEACAQRHPFAYIPFSAGPRNCIGQRYAMLDMKTGIIQLLRNYKFFIADKLPKMKIGYSIILYPTNGVNVRIEKRYS